ncbi:MAG: MFS transporter, partial [Rhodobacteraceae bacterium]|nr:MFS transporter [Paracoccaceae bacterium]
GRKPLLLIGGVGYVVTNTIFGAVIDARLALSINASLAFTLMATTRGLYSLTSGAVYPTTMALVADLTSRENRASGVALIGATWGLGSVVGPGVAAAFSGFGATVPIYAVSAFAAISTLLYVVNIHEPRRHVALAQPSFRSILTRQTLSIVAAFGLLIMGNIGLMVCLGFHFQDRFALDTASTTRAVGLAFSCQAVAQILVQVVLIKRLGWSPRKMVSVGMPIVIAASATLNLTASYPVALAAMMLMGFGGGFGWPAFMTASSLSAGPENQGSVAGLTTSFQSIGFMIGPLIGTAAYATNHAFPFYLQMGIAAVIVMIVNVIRMPRP